MAITANGPTDICPGESVTLTATAGLNAYSWIKDGSEVATTQSYVATEPGTYVVAGYDVNGCDGLSEEVVIGVFGVPDVSISTDDETTFCAGGSITLTATAGFDSYEWSNGASGQSIEVSESGNYTVTATTADGCDKVSSNSIDVTVQVDSDGDGICDVDDSCPNFYGEVGDTCDDNNANTENDMITSACVCAGTPIDEFECPNLQANVGDACNDNNPNTNNDVVDENCNCVGAANVSLLTLECGGQVIQITGALAGGNAGGNATSETRTVYGFMPDNGNGTPNYTGSVWPYVIIEGGLEIDASITATLTINADGVLLINGWPAYQFSGDASATDVSGTFGPWNYFLPDGSLSQDACGEEFDCPVVQQNFGDPCDDGDPLTENDERQTDCSCAGTPIVPVYDCPDAQQNYGDACDDGDPLTENDERQTDCSCAGTPIVPVYDCPDAQQNYGDACDDGDPLTENDIRQDDCSCAGTPIVPVYDCPDAQQNYGDACDDGDPLTENDVRQTDCSCAGTPIEPVYDCPDAEQNFGDACDDGDPLTENDVRQTDCSCAGTPIEPVYDCPDAEQNFGDACDDGDPLTENDVRQTDCSCAGTPIEPSTCNNFVYFLSDHSAADGITDIFGVTLNGGNADLEYIATSDIEVHIAYNPIDNLIYAVSKHTNSYRVLDPYAAVPTFGPTVDLGADYGELTAAAFNADGKLLIGSQNNNAIYSVNVSTNVVSTYDTYAPVTGGDLAFSTDGMLYLATRTGNGLYEVWPADVMPDQFIGSVPNNVTGLAITDTDQLIMSSRGNTNLEVRNSSDGSDAGSYAVMLNGEAYTLRDGDMASGCDTHSNVGDDCGYKLYYIHTPSGGGNQPLLEVTLNNDGTASYNAIIANIGGHIGLSPDGSTIYNVGGSDLKVIDVSTASVINTVNIHTAGGQNLSGFPAAVVSADGTLYIAGQNQVYSVDPASGIAIPYGPSRAVNGGDLIEANGEIWVITRNNNTFTNVLTGASFTVPVNEINGAAVLSNGNVLLADGNGGSLMKEVDLSTHLVVGSYDLGLPLYNGDLAGGCTNTNPVIIPGDCYAAEVVEYVQGVKDNGNSINIERTDVNEALGMPERTDALVYVSLGYGGSIILGFDGAVPNGAGDDIEVVETTYNFSSCSAYPEYADVYVSLDGESWFFAKTVCHSDGFIDIDDAGDFDYINYVKIVNNNELSETPDAFDVDGVVALHNCEVANPGAIAEDAQSELTSYPNPTSGVSEVVFIPAETGITLVEVYDMNGRNVATLFNQVANAKQQYRLNFHGNNLPNGVYIYRLTTNSETIINKFMIAK